MRVATWNVNSLRARMAHVERFSAEGGCDVICLQETKLTDDLFPEAELKAMGWSHIAFWGQPTYNGVAILSKHPIDDVQRGFAGYDDDEEVARILSGTIQGVRIYGLYTPNGQSVGSPKFHYKLRWLAQLRAELERYDPAQHLLVCGDMNIAPASLDVWDPFKLDGQLLCHPHERQALQHVLDWGLVDAWRERHRFASEFSWFDYQRMGFQRGFGLRIDHVFLTESLNKRCTAARIHVDVRGWDTPSDHAPVSVDLSL